MTMRGVLCSGQYIVGTQVYGRIYLKKGMSSGLHKRAFLRSGFGHGFRSVRTPGQSGEAHALLIQDHTLTAEVPLRRSILQSTLRQKYRSAGDITHSVTAVLRKDFIGFTRLPCSGPAFYRRADHLFAMGRFRTG